MIKFQACLCLYQTISTISNSDFVVFFWLEIYTDEIYQYFLWLEKKSATKKVGLKSLTMKSTGKFDLQKISKGRFFSESMMHFSHCPKNVPKTILKKRF